MKLSILIFLTFLICANAASTTMTAGAIEAAKDENTKVAPAVGINTGMKSSVNTEDDEDPEIETDPKSDLVLSNYAVDTYYHDHFDKCKKKKKCDYKKKCYKKDCDCDTKKYDCNCHKVAYKCCDYKKYDCNCYYKTKDCNCKQIKYVCGYDYDYYHGSSHVSVPETAHSGYGYGKYKKPKYCYKTKCDTCKEKVCDTCKKYYCDICKKEVCDTCKKEVCKTCKKCEKVFVGCKYFKKCYGH